MGIYPIPSDNVPLEETTINGKKLLRWKLTWFSFLQAVATFPRSYTVAGLPANAAPGTVLYTSDGRKPGESHGAGTGMLVFYSNGSWISVSSGAAITA